MLCIFLPYGSGDANRNRNSVSSIELVVQQMRMSTVVTVNNGQLQNNEFLRVGILELYVCTWVECLLPLVQQSGGSGHQYKNQCSNLVWGKAQVLFLEDKFLWPSLRKDIDVDQREWPIWLSLGTTLSETWDKLYNFSGHYIQYL